MKIKTIAPWFGSNRLLAQSVGDALGKLAWCGVPFMGGAPELPHIRTRGGLANDLHRHVINLARCIADVEKREQLEAMLRGRLFHPDELAKAQRRCRGREQPMDSWGHFSKPAHDDGDVQWAADYFAACWMGRGGHAGKKTEFTQNLAVRWTASGGGSARRFQSAIESLSEWHQCLKSWEFTCMDVFDFLDRVKDQPDHGLYVDAPWPDAGQEYEHSFSTVQQRRLAKRLGEFNSCRLVIRYGDHPLIRELYSVDRWNWIEQTSRSQTNGAVDEVLITRRC